MKPELAKAQGYQQIPEDLWDSICPLPPNLRRILYPQQSEPE